MAPTAEPLPALPLEREFVLSLHMFILLQCCVVTEDWPVVLFPDLGFRSLSVMASYLSIPLPLSRSDHDGGGIKAILLLCQFGDTDFTLFFFAGSLHWCKKLK